ncbi:hypothetical protein Taro_007958 [Colocasia esculenta]|uniref:3-ketoacyl-CoA synthase n=1 Tax=Colocasia esculenta TaxID=4460 RepID=A0A843TWX9_COLES|nr:hypothetical protein [Colocasia esculenta]
MLSSYAAMKPLLLLTPIRLLQASFFLLLALTVALHALFSTTSSLVLEGGSPLLLLISAHRLPLLSLLWCALLALLAYLCTRPRPVLLLDYACYLPAPDRRLTYETCEYFVRRAGRYSRTSEEFMRGIYLKSGLGDETYAPAFIFESGHDACLASALQEAEEGIFAAVDAVLAQTRVDPARLDAVVVSCGMFSPSPSLTSLLVRRYGFRPSVKTFNLSGMGCSSGTAAVDLAARLLRSSREVRYVLVVVTESISLNWYFGDDRSMLVTNCIFRVGSAAAVVTNDPARRRDAKMELLHFLRTHHGADDAAYRAAYQEEDAAGIVGIGLKKDLIRVAGEGLREHIRALAPHVLPLSQLVAYAYAVATAWWGAADGKAKSKPYVPDFTAAFEHVCIHTGGKAVIEAVERVMRLPEGLTEPARMTLHRFGNTSSSLVFYELAYFEAKGRIHKGDRMWMLAFGTGFKVCSLVWRSLKGSSVDANNPWRDCIHRYPLKAW